MISLFWNTRKTYLIKTAAEATGKLFCGPSKHYFVMLLEREILDGIHPSFSLIPVSACLHCCCSESRNNDRLSLVPFHLHPYSVFVPSKFLMKIHTHWLCGKESKKYIRKSKTKMFCLFYKIQSCPRNKLLGAPACLHFLAVTWK